MLLMTGLTLFQFCYRSSITLRWAFGIPIFILLGYLGGTLSNPSPDTAVSLLQIVMVLLLVTLIQSNEAFCDQRQLLVSTLIILSIIIFTIKVSSAMFALLTFLFTLFYANKNFFNNYKWKNLFFISLIIGCMHLIRGYLLSGAPLYPSEFGSLLSLPWAMSPDTILGERLWVYVWSRLPGALPAEVLGSWTWFPYWIADLSYDIFLFFSVLIILILSNIWVIFFNNTTFASRYKFLLLNFIILGPIAFWFLSAPQIRFLGALPFILLCLNLWFFIDHNKHKINMNYLNLYGNKRLLINSIVILITCLISLKLIGLRSISLNGWSPLPNVITNYKITGPGLIINSPISGNQCWNTPLPCSPQVKDELDIMSWPADFFILDYIQKRPIYRLKY